MKRLSSSAHCTYCSSLKTIDEKNNYCSIHAHQNQTQSSVGNAFYVKSNQLRSNRHISRLTFRTVLDGYQYYMVDDHEHMIKKDNYLIVNDGESYYNEIDSKKPVESLIVAFEEGRLGEVFHHSAASAETLLSDPDLKSSDNISFHPFKNTYSLNTNISSLAKALKSEILSESKDRVRYEELQYQLLEELIVNHIALTHDIEKIQTTKKSTRVELYKRISTAKDYIDSHFNENLSLSQLSRVATLSPYHFLRSFKKMYLKTPWEYLTEERLDHAKYLLLNSDFEIKDILQAVGYENSSSFSRLFKSYFKETPLAYRNKHFRMGENSIIRTLT